MHRGVKCVKWWTVSFKESQPLLICKIRVYEQIELSKSDALGERNHAN